MFVNSIDNKPFWTRPDGVVIRDLTDTMFNLKNKNYVTYSVYRVPRDYAMRPDLISRVVYNNSAYAEMILKYNGISNPFTINEGDMILVPNLESAQATVNKREKTGKANGADAIRNSYKYIDPTKAPKKGQELQNFDDRAISTNANINGISGGLGAGAGVGDSGSGFGTSGAGGTGTGGISGTGTGFGMGSGTGGQIGTAGLATGPQVGVGNGALPPNIAQAGATQITYRNGRVYFGDSVANCLKSGSSTSEFLTNVIKSKGQQ